MSNINAVPMVMVLHSYSMRLGVRTDIRMYGRTDSRMTTKIFEIDGLPNFLRYGAPLARLRCTGALLLFVSTTPHMRKLKKNANANKQ